MILSGLKDAGFYRILKREIGRIWNDKRLRSVVLIAPFIYALLLSGVYSRHTVERIPIAVMVHDHSGPARALLRMVKLSSKLDVVEIVTSTAEIEDLFLRGQIDAALAIPSDFSYRLKRGRDTTVTGFLNAASLVPANTAGKALTQVVQTLSAGIEIKSMMKRGDRLDMAKEKFMPVKLDMRSLFNPAYNYSNFMVPGLLMSVLQQVILLGLALTWTSEKEFKTLPELFAISRSPVQIILGKSLPYILINFVVAEIFLRVLMPLNDIPMEGAWWLAISFTFLFVLTVTFWGMWVSLLCRTRLFATQALMFVALPSFLLSGFTWPSTALPPLLQFLHMCLPISYFVTSFRKIYLAGAPVQYITSDILSLAAFLLFNIFLTWLILTRILKRFSETDL